MFKVTWDKARNLVRLCETAPEAEVLAIAPRPVFWEELDLLGLNRHGWRYPHCEEPLLWACQRQYFHNGELVLEARGGNIYDAPALIFHGRGDPGNVKNPPHSKTGESATFILAPIDLDALRNLNAGLMFLLEYEAMEFIHNTWRKYGRLKKLRETSGMNAALDFERMRREFEKREKKPHAIIKEDCDSFDVMPLDTAESLGKQTVLSTRTEMFIASFSGGKDSQVVLDLVTRAVPPDAFRVIYSDTGYEIPPSLDTWELTRQFYKQRHPSLQFHLSRNHQDVLYYWDKMGSPSRMHRWCCGVMKTAPLYRELKEIFGEGRQPHVLTFDGIRAEESERRSRYSRIGKGVKHNNVINASPILRWNLTEIFLYLFERKLPMNSAYRNGVTRAGCVICPFGSDWNDYFCNKFYPSKIDPFLNKVREIVEHSGVPDVENYIRQGNWKNRAGGRDFVRDFSLNIVSTSPDFKAVIKNPQEDFMTWFKTLGEYTFSQEGGEVVERRDSKTGDHSFLRSDKRIEGSVKYKNRIFEFKIIEQYTKRTTSIVIKNIGDEILFVSHLKKVLNKTTYCTHCELCEVECPTGALNVIDAVTVNTQKCIHCLKCLDFNEKGCICAKSLAITTGIKNKMKSTKSKSKEVITKYNGFGFRESWLAKYFQAPQTFFKNDSHGLNEKYQIPPFKDWLKHAEILNEDKENISMLGALLCGKYVNNIKNVWEIIWINISYNSGIAKRYSERINFDRPFQRAELYERLFESSSKAPSTLKGALNALINTFTSSPLGEEIGVWASPPNDEAIAVRKSSATISLPAIAYSLYRYAEKNGRHNLTVGEFYDATQKSGIYRQFGISRDAFETALRTLKEEKNRVLDADLNMGLDNIKLREDLTATKVLELLF